MMAITTRTSTSVSPGRRLIARVDGPWGRCGGVRKGTGRPWRCRTSRQERCNCHEKTRRAEWIRTISSVPRGWRHATTDGNTRQSHSSRDSATRPEELRQSPFARDRRAGRRCDATTMNATRRTVSWHALRWTERVRSEGAGPGNTPSFKRVGSQSGLRH